MVAQRGFQREDFAREPAPDPVFHVSPASPASRGQARGQVSFLLAGGLGHFRFSSIILTGNNKSRKSISFLALTKVRARVFIAGGTF
jgi:hypothetical protein